MLTVSETALAMSAILLPSRLVATAVSVGYLTLAIGVVVFRLRRGALPCGCWGGGSHSVLGWRLAAVDLALASAVMGVALRVDATMPPFVDRVTSAALAVLLALLLGVIIPAFRSLDRRARFMADPYRAWAKGFPDLIPDGAPGPSGGTAQ